MTKGDDNNQNIKEAFAKFLEFYAPATLDKATDFFTTKEVISAINDIFPVEIAPEEIVVFMKENNFDYMPEPHKFSLSLKWITKKRI